MKGRKNFRISFPAVLFHPLHYLLGGEGPRRYEPRIHTKARIHTHHAIRIEALSPAHRVLFTVFAVFPGLENLNPVYSADPTRGRNLIMGERDVGLILESYRLSLNVSLFASPPSALFLTFKFTAKVIHVRFISAQSRNAKWTIGTISRDYLDYSLQNRCRHRKGLDELWIYRELCNSIDLFIYSKPERVTY